MTEPPTRTRWLIVGLIFCTYVLMISDRVNQSLGWDSALYMAAALALPGAFFWLWIHPERAIELGEEALALPQKTVVVGGKPQV
jgi:hypothetical protein